MALAKEIQLLLKDATAAITSAVVIAEDHRQRIGKRRDPPGQPQVSITQIPDEQHRIRLESGQNLLIRSSPGSVEVTGDRNAQNRQNRCLGWCHPAPARFDER